MTDLEPQDRAGDDPSSSSTVIVGMVGAILLVVTVLALQGLYYRSRETEERAKVVEPVPELRQVVAAQQQQELSSYHWVDREAGTVAIPIDEAMDLVIRERGGVAVEGR